MFSAGGGRPVPSVQRRWADPGYVTLLRAERTEVVRPEPFDAIELHVGSLFGDDPAA